MNNIDIDRIYKLGRLKFKNYVFLSKYEKTIIFDYRNDEEVRRMMHRNSLISFDEHLKFIENLSIDTNNFYWAVYKNENIVAGVYLNFNEENTPYWGIFLNPKFIGTGLGMEVQFETFNLFFDEYDLKEIRAEVMIKNKDSLSIQKRFLFEELSTDKEEGMVFMKLSVEDWKKLPKTYKDFKKEIFKNERSSN